MRFDKKKSVMGLMVFIALAMRSQAKDDLPLTVATQNYAHTRLIRDGSVRVPGSTVTYITLSLLELNDHAFGDKRFDVTEVEFLPFLTKIGTAETADYVLIPVFPLREFQFRNIWVRTDRNIQSPADLKGKTVAVAGYHNTQATWIRGYLQSSASITDEDLTWVDTWTLGKDQTPWDLLLNGKVDAVFDQRLPPPDAKGVARLFPDYRLVEQAQFAKTRVFPIVTALAVRKRLLEENAWLAEALFMAFCEAKRKAIDNLETENDPKIPLPWGPESLKETLNLMGKNYWSYGVPNNPKTLTALLNFANKTGLVVKSLKMEDVFDPSTIPLFER